MKHVTLAVLDVTPPALFDLIGEQLSGFNEATVGASDWQDLCVTVTVDGRCMGGLVGNTAWGWLFIKWLWIADDIRGQGIAGRILAQAERVALQRGCHGAWIDTFNPVAKRVYERAGFSIFGSLPDFPIGHTRFFLRKRLVSA